MRHEYCEKNGIIITYSDSDVAFEERETALSILKITGRSCIIILLMIRKRHNVFWKTSTGYIRLFVTSGLLIKWGMLSDAGVC